MNYKVSVIVPVYNTAPWLRRCLDSICAQSYANLEILCVNDGSTDNSAEILAEYAARDERVRVFTQTNAGLSAARNTALQHATGEWVTGVDSDDYLYPGVYKKAISCCNNGVDLVFFGVREETEDSEPLPHNDYFDLPNSGVYLMTPELAAKLNVCFCSKLWRRSLIEENNLRFPVGLVHEDEAMYHIACPYITNIAICPAIGYAYMQRQGSIMNEAGLDTYKRVKRRVHILEQTHSEYEKRGFLHSKECAYLTELFIKLCCSNLKETDKETYALQNEVIEKCRMKYAHYKLERRFPSEKKGLFTILRFSRVKLYCFMCLPVWIELYTRHVNKITLSLILFHIKRAAARILLSRYNKVTVRIN